MKTRIVILAAGEGKRMNHSLPKVLHSLKGKPIIQYLVEAVINSGVDLKPVLVVSPKNTEAIKEVLGDKCEYVLQENQLGTGHALQAAQSLLEGKTGTVIVLNGDHPFIKETTIKKLKNFHKEKNCPVTMITCIASDFDVWRQSLYSFGRVIRDENGEIERIVEEKDATSFEREIKEVNLNMFAFSSSWLWKNLDKLENNNVQKEYYLVDLVGLAVIDGECVTSMSTSPIESIGINTPEHLKMAEELIK
jgi:bifunctional UDP-N-acetylglucosamine pyrophosphorylase / glucosamine-1-phosphate N-acetyltransferase